MTFRMNDFNGRVAISKLFLSHRHPKIVRIVLSAVFYYNLGIFWFYFKVDYKPERFHIKSQLMTDTIRV